MRHQGSRKSYYGNPPTRKDSSQLPQRPFVDQTQQDYRDPLTQEEIENKVFRQNKFEASGLQLKEESGTIIPVEQERLGVLQAKRNDFWAQRMGRLSHVGNDFARITVHPSKSNSSNVNTQQKPQKLSDNIQAKLKVSHPQDAAEIEADRIADRVVNNQPIDSHAISHKGGVGRSMGIKTSTSNRSSTAEVSRQIDSTIGSSGSPLPEGIRVEMESKMAQDFSAVKIHNDDKAHKSANAINAKAYNKDNEIVFGKGEYKPVSSEGKHLLAHELVHIVMQGDGIYRKKKKTEDQKNEASKFDINEVDIDVNALFEYLEKQKETELLNLLEKAFISSDIYNDSLDDFLVDIESRKYDDLREYSGIHRLTDDELTVEGLKPEFFANSESGFYAGLYYNGRTEEYVLAFRGTEGKRRLNGVKQPEAIKDWKYGNDPQTIGLEAQQYTDAMDLGMHINDNFKKEYTITGHSLGGGLGAAVTVLLQKKGTITFNAAGLHRNTVWRYQKSKEKSKDLKMGPGKWQSRHLIESYHVKGDVVTKAQRGGKVFLSIFLGPLSSLWVPLAAGGISNVIRPADKSKSSMQRHQMSEVIDSLLQEHDVFIKMNL